MEPALLTATHSRCVLADPNIIEEWRPVEGWPYEVSSLGKVRRTLTFRGAVRIRHLHMMNLSCEPTGYYSVVLQDAGHRWRCRVHILVCASFHGPKPSPQHQVAHWDGDQSNNQPNNLRWALPKENSQDNIRHNKTTAGQRHPMAKLNIESARAVFVASGSYRKIAEAFGISRATVCLIKRRRNWRTFTLDL